jgi:hypothetical protein
MFPFFWASPHIHYRSQYTLHINLFPVTMIVPQDGTSDLRRTAKFIYGKYVGFTVNEMYYVSLYGPDAQPVQYIPIHADVGIYWPVTYADEPPSNSLW